MKWIALLRAVNLGPHNRVPMAELKTLIEASGFNGARTLLQSGNAVFGGGRSSAAIERTLEQATAKRLGVTTDYFVRSAAEWEAMIAANPFRAEAKRDPGHLLAMPLKAAPKAAQVKALAAAIKGREYVEIVGRELYLVYPDGVGNSKLTITLIERTLETRGTGRNWNTVLKLAALVGE
jgi:uncharacterized protein (DUF1697 family)